MVRFENVSVSIGNKPILKNISFALQKGQKVALMGRSGSGKSTLLRSIAGFVAPSQGAIFINGQKVSEAGNILLPPHKRGVGMIFQDLALWPHMSVTQNVEFGLKIKGVPSHKRKEMVERFLDMVGLQGYGSRAIHQLSGGERQRVALARALILEPPLLLMDEPLSSLDEELKEELLETILTLQRQLGFTLLFVTHSSEEAKKIGMVWRLEGGKLYTQPAKS